MSTVGRPGKDQRWLLALPPEVDVICSDPGIERAIMKVVRKKPFCYKDPRFSYTFPVWRRHLPDDTISICMFREPDLTVESILKECRDREYLADLLIDRSDAYQVWIDIYSHILFKHASANENLFFVHYNQIFDGSAILPLSGILEVQLDGNFVDRNLKRSAPAGRIPPKAKEIYDLLCRQARYTD
jgi:hypothetical protein